MSTSDGHVKSWLRYTSEQGCLPLLVRLHFFFVEETSENSDDYDAYLPHNVLLNRSQKSLIALKLARN